MTGYGKYAKRQIVMQDLVDDIEDLIRENMHELYLKRNPPPPKDNTTQNLNLFGENGSLSFQIIGKDEHLMQVSAATTRDLACLKIDTNAYRIKVWVFVQTVCAVLTFMMWEPVWRFLWPFCMIIYTIINFNDLQFFVLLKKREMKVYKEIEDKENEKLVEGIIEK